MLRCGGVLNKSELIKLINNMLLVVSQLPKAFHSLVASRMCHVWQVIERRKKRRE